MISLYSKKPGLFFVSLTLYFIATFLLPIMKYISTVYVDVIVVFMLYTIIFMRNPSRFLNFIAPFLILIILQTIDGVFRAKNILDVLLNIYSNMYSILPLIICFYLIVNNQFKIISYILLEVFVFIIITVISSIFGLHEFPFASRELASGMSGDPKFMVYCSRNIAAFDFTYLIPIILPMLFLVFIPKKLNIFLVVFLIIVVVNFIILTQYATAIIFTFLSLLSLVFASNFSKKKFFILTLIVSIFFLFLRPIIGELFFYIATNNTSPDVAIRFMALGEKLLGIESSNDAYLLREEVYNKSINVFLSDPFFGGVIHGNKNIGGHSFIIDLITSYGLLGFMALYFTYRQIFRKLYVPFKNESYYGYMVWSMILSIVLAILNTLPNILAIGFIIPLIAFNIKNTEYTIIGKS